MLTAYGRDVREKNFAEVIFAEPAVSHACKTTRVATKEGVNIYNTLSYSTPRPPGSRAPLLGPNSLVPGSGPCRLSKFEIGVCRLSTHTKSLAIGVGSSDRCLHGERKRFVVGKKPTLDSGNGFRMCVFSVVRAKNEKRESLSPCVIPFWLDACENPTGAPRDECVRLAPHWKIARRLSIRLTNFKKMVNSNWKIRLRWFWKSSYTVKGGRANFTRMGDDHAPSRRTTVSTRTQWRRQRWL